MGDLIVRKTEEDLEREKKEEKKARKRTAVQRILGAVWLAAGIGCFMGGAFAGINALVFTGIGILFALPVIASGVALIGIILKSKNSSQGNKKARVMKAAVCGLLFAALVAFIVLGSVFSGYFFIGTVACGFALVITFFGWII